MKHQPPNREADRLCRALALSSQPPWPSAACGGGDAGTRVARPRGGGGGDEAVAVTLITKTSTNPFFIAMQEGAEEAGKANNVTITTAAGKEDGDEATQIAAIEAAIARGDQGILITPATDGVNPAIEAARDAGLYVIALDTPPNPPDTVDITFATDNFKAGELIGKWAAAHHGRQEGHHRPARPVQRQGRLRRLQPRPGLPDRHGHRRRGQDEERRRGQDRQVHRRQGGDYEIVCNEPTNGAQDQGKTAMETCLAKSKDINLVYTINEPAGVGAAEALEAAGRQGDHRLRRRRLRPGHHGGEERHHRRHLAAVPGEDGQARRRGDRQEGPRRA